MGHYIPSTREEQRDMLNAIGVESVAAFFADVPESVLLKAVKSSSRESGTGSAQRSGRHEPPE